MELTRYIQQRGVITTRDEAVRTLGRVFWATYDGIITPEELLLNADELRRFCDLVRKEWGVDVPDSLIVRAVEEAGMPRYLPA